MFFQPYEDPIHLEQAFKEAYTRRHGSNIKEFRVLDDGNYLINGIRVTEIEVYAMLETMQGELAEMNRGLIHRLVDFFRRPG